MNVIYEGDPETGEITQGQAEIMHFFHYLDLKYRKDCRHVRVESPVGLCDLPRYHEGEHHYG